MGSWLLVCAAMGCQEVSETLVLYDMQHELGLATIKPRRDPCVHQEHDYRSRGKHCSPVIIAPAHISVLKNAFVWFNVPLIAVSC
jgi:hypothetical protein